MSWRTPGFHQWRDSTKCYLSTVHRHLFHFKVFLSVSGSDREIEFHALQTECLVLLGNMYMRKPDGGGLLFENDSCETIAEKLAEKLLERYVGRVVVVEVSEDGECGSQVRLSEVW